MQLSGITKRRARAFRLSQSSPKKSAPRDFSTLSPIHGPESLQPSPRFILGTDVPDDRAPRGVAAEAKRLASLERCARNAQAPAITPKRTGPADRALPEGAGPHWSPRPRLRSHQGEQLRAEEVAVHDELRVAPDQRYRAECPSTRPADRGRPWRPTGRFSAPARSQGRRRALADALDLPVWCRSMLCVGGDCDGDRT